MLIISRDQGVCFFQDKLLDFLGGFIYFRITSIDTDVLLRTDIERTCCIPLAPLLLLLHHTPGTALLRFV